MHISTLLVLALAGAAAIGARADDDSAVVELATDGFDARVGSGEWLPGRAKSDARPSVMKALLDAGADPNAADNEGETAMAKAIRNKRRMPLPRGHRCSPVVE